MPTRTESVIIAETMVFIAFLLKLSLAAARPCTVQDPPSPLFNPGPRASPLHAINQNNVRKTILAIPDIAPIPASRVLMPSREAHSGLGGESLSKIFLM
jgi:hypothetical protein